MCLYPKLILNPKYKPNKKNGGKAPPIKDHRVKYVPKGCEKCMECKKQKTNEWRTRLMEDRKFNNNVKFITLTFSDEHYTKITEAVTREIQNQNREIPTGYTLDNEIATYAVRHFLERWRKKFKHSLRHWLVTELGHQGTENIHLHGLIWTDIPLELVEKVWSYGWMWKGKPVWNHKEQQYNYWQYVNEKTINYIVKYVYKTDEKHKGYTPIILTSAGIGHQYTENPNGDWKKNKYNDTKTNESYRTRTGHKTALPIYYRNKIYTEDEREKLWLQKLDKQQRWVLGSKIDIKNGEEQYNAALKAAQEKNKKLGYGDDSLTWEQETYERQRRMLMQQQRINNANRKLT